MGIESFRRSIELKGRRLGELRRKRGASKGRKRKTPSPVKQMGPLGPNVRIKNLHICLDLRLRRQAQQYATPAHFLVSRYILLRDPFLRQSSLALHCCWRCSCLWLSALMVTMVMATHHHKSQAKRQSGGRALGERRTNQEEEPTHLCTAFFSSWISLL